MPSKTLDLDATRDKLASVTLDNTDDGTGAPASPREYKTFAFKAGDTTGLQDDEFQGYLSTFNNVDDAGDIILPGAFTNTIPEFLQSGVVCWQHDWMTPIGKWLEAREDSYGLFVKGRISQTTAGKDALILLRDGVIKKLSIGYRALGYKILSDQEGISLLGETAYNAALRTLPWYQDGIRALTDIQLFEGSPVTVPANNRADITGVKEGLLAGRTFDAHFSAVLIANGELLTRVKSLADLRAKEGRVLSDANRSKLVAMKESLGEHVQTLDALIVAATPMPADDADGAGKAAGAAALADLALAEMARFQKMQAHLSGVL